MNVSRPLTLTVLYHLNKEFVCFSPVRDSCSPFWEVRKRCWWLPALIARGIGVRAFKGFQTLRQPVHVPSQIVHIPFQIAHRASHAVHCTLNMKKFSVGNTLVSVNFGIFWIAEQSHLGGAMRIIMMIGRATICGAMCGAMRPLPRAGLESVHRFVGRGFVDFLPYVI